MDDLEMTKLCAEATEALIEMQWLAGFKSEWPMICDDFGIWHVYNPLHDDAQAMALVKKLGLTCITELGQGREIWRVHHWRDSGLCHHGDLNRAIVECVAKMVAARTPVA